MNTSRTIIAFAILTMWAFSIALTLSLHAANSKGNKTSPTSQLSTSLKELQNTVAQLEQRIHNLEGRPNSRLATTEASRTSPEIDQVTSRSFEERIAHLEEGNRLLAPWIEMTSPLLDEMHKHTKNNSDSISEILVYISEDREWIQKLADSDIETSTAISELRNDVETLIEVVEHYHFDD